MVGFCLVVEFCWGGFAHNLEKFKDISKYKEKQFKKKVVASYFDVQVFVLSKARKPGPIQQVILELVTPTTLR